jgi:hypothetical protein
MRKLKTHLGRTIRDIRRKTANDEDLRDAFRQPSRLAVAGSSPHRLCRGDHS